MQKYTNQVFLFQEYVDTITSAPEGFSVAGSTAQTPCAVFENHERSIFGTQFHPEVKHSNHGQEILKNFLYLAALCAPTWTNTSIIADSIEAIQKQVGKSKVICALSGGVDSSVAAALMHQAIDDQLTCV